MDSTSFKPSGPSPCANGCGFFGSDSTLNLCSKCYRDLRVKEEKTIEKTNAPSDFVKVPIKEEISAFPEKAQDPNENKCGTCKKRVRITRAFKCKCGFLFCESHRYPEVHQCSFDYKKLGEHEIAKSNPLIKADKIQRI